MIKKIPAAKHLTDNEYRLLLQVYANHNRSMGRKESANYTLSHIVKIKRNSKENCLEVYYENGDWWKYYDNGTWG